MPMCLTDLNHWAIILLSSLSLLFNLPHALFASHSFWLHHITFRVYASLHRGHRSISISAYHIFEHSEKYYYHQRSSSSFPLNFLSSTVAEETHCSIKDVSTLVGLGHHSWIFRKSMGQILSWCILLWLDFNRSMTTYNN